MVKVVSDQPQAFAETLIMNDLALTEIADWITDFRIFDKTQNIIVGQTRFLALPPCLRACQQSGRP